MPSPLKLHHADRPGADEPAMVDLTGPVRPVVVVAREHEHVRAVSIVRIGRHEVRRDAVVGAVDRGVDRAERAQPQPHRAVEVRKSDIGLMTL